MLVVLAKVRTFRAMDRILAYIRLFRLPNLVIVFLTQAIPYWFVLRPGIARSGGIPNLSERTFWLLSAATVLTTLGGYVINDYFDRDIDRINKPNRVVIGRYLPPFFAIVFYWVIIAAVALLALELYLNLPAPRQFWPLWLFPLISFILFLYAWTLKCTPIIGNIVVSLMCAIVPLVLLAPEQRPLWLASFRQPELVNQINASVWLYGLFAFVTNLFREQIKDLEDFQGDSQCGCHTLPVMKGIRYAKNPAGFTGLCVSALVGLLLYYWMQTQAPDWQIAGGIAVLLLPSLLATIFIYAAKMKKHYTWASMCIKIVMFFGLFLLLRSWETNFPIRNFL